MIVPTDLKGWKPAKAFNGGRYGAGVTYDDPDRAKMERLMDCLDMNWSEPAVWWCPSWPSEPEHTTGLQIDCDDGDIVAEIRSVFG